MDPTSVKGAEIGGRLHALDLLAVFVEVEEALCEHTHDHANGAALPFGMEYRFVGFELDRAEAIHPAMSWIPSIGFDPLSRSAN